MTISLFYPLSVMFLFILFDSYDVHSTKVEIKFSSTASRIHDILRAQTWVTPTFHHLGVIAEFRPLLLVQRKCDCSHGPEFVFQSFHSDGFQILAPVTFIRIACQFLMNFLPSSPHIDTLSHYILSFRNVAAIFALIS